MGEKVCPVLSEHLSSSGVFPSSYVYCFRYFESIKQSILTDLPYFRLSNWEYLSLIYMARLRNKFQHHEIIHSVICACAWYNLVHQPFVDSSRDKRSANDKLSSWIVSSNYFFISITLWISHVLFSVNVPVIINHNYGYNKYVCS